MTRYTKLEFAEKESITIAILNSWIYKHGLPVVQIGKRTYIMEDDFKEWFLSHKKVISEQATTINREQISLPRNLRRKSGILSELRLAR